MFLKMGLDSPNQIESFQQIPLCAQMVHPSGYEEFSISRTILGARTMLGASPPIG
jgi:hypothetical protein